MTAQRQDMLQFYGNEPKAAEPVQSSLMGSRKSDRHESCLLDERYADPESSDDQQGYEPDWRKQKCRDLGVVQHRAILFKHK